VCRWFSMKPAKKTSLRSALRLSASNNNYTLFSRGVKSFLRPIAYLSA